MGRDKEEATNGRCVVWVSVFKINLCVYVFAAENGSKAHARETFHTCYRQQAVVATP